MTTHAQPKKSAVAIFGRILANHQRSLSAASEHNEPAARSPLANWKSSGVKEGLQRAEEVGDDVAAAIEDFFDFARLHAMSQARECAATHGQKPTMTPRSLRRPRSRFRLVSMRDRSDSDTERPLP